MSGSAVTDVILATVGGGTPVRVSCASTVASWVTSDVGQLSAIVPWDEVKRCNLVDILGRWIYWTHPTAGDWAGIVTPPVNSADGLEIGADSFESLLRAKSLPVNYSLQMASAGMLALRAISDVNLPDSPLWLTSKRADGDGAPITIDTGGGDLLDFIRQLAEDANMEWRVTADRGFEFGVNLGRDLTADFELVDGKHIVELSRPHGDLWQIRNDLVGVGAAIQGRTTPTARVADSTSISTYGRLQDRRDYPDAVSAADVAVRLRKELTRLASPISAPEITLVDEDGCYSFFRESDPIRITVAGVSLAYKVTSRALQDNGTMLCGGVVRERLV